jgi:hypothetical protein
MTGERKLPILDSFLSEEREIRLLPRHCLVDKAYCLLTKEHCLNFNLHPNEAILIPPSTRVMQTATGYQFYYFQQIEDPSIVYVIGKWVYLKLNAHQIETLFLTTINYEIGICSCPLRVHCWC